MSRAHARTWAMLALVAATCAPAAQDSADQDSADQDSADQSDGSTPSRELLEFLGRFETADGDWLDPLSLDASSEEPRAGTSDGDGDQDDSTHTPTAESDDEPDDGPDDSADQGPAHDR